MNRKLLFEAKDRVGLRTKGLQQFLNAGEIPMLERNLKLLQGGATIYAIMPGFVATLPLQVYRWMFDHCKHRCIIYAVSINTEV